MPGTKSTTQRLADRVRSRLAVLYPDEDLDALTPAVLAAAGLSAAGLSAAVPAEPDGEPDAAPAQPRWTESDVVVIAYADSVTEPDVAPLRTLRSTLADLTGDAFTTVHLLPFFPATSDGGFAVVDHKAVAARLGAWADVEAIAGDFTLMADLVCNHVSSRHAWVLDLLAGRRSAGADCLMTASPDDDLSAVVRPRTNPLLRAVDTPAGERHLWCTFSHDQVDVDYRRPEALLELLSVVDTLLGHGVRWLRLDAVAYVWKEPGTACVHLPQCHELVKLLRDLVGVRDRRAVVITETNVPHDQNASYFGDGDEAHVVYNFALPPLLVHSFVSGSAAALQRWAAGLGAAPAGTTYLNFLAGHDGIGLRPVEELLSAAETDRLVAAAHAAGGGHSDYDAGGGRRPYELNVSLFSLFTARGEGPDGEGAGELAGGPDGELAGEHGVAHYLAAHTIMLSLAGVPAFYLHSLFATPNRRPDAGAGTGTTDSALTPRAINRPRLRADELVELLDADDGRRRGVLAELLRRIRIRKGQPAFHPDSAQRSLSVDDRVFAIVRGDGTERGQARGQARGQVVSLTNVSATRVTIDAAVLGGELAGGGPAGWAASPGWTDLLAGRSYGTGEAVGLEPGQSVWLVPAAPAGV